MIAANVTKTKLIADLAECQRTYDVTALKLAEVTEQRDKLSTTLRRLDRYLSGIMEYDHGVFNADGETPSKVVRAAIDKSEGKSL